MKKISILGTEYAVEIHKVSEDNFLKENNYAGYCNEEGKLIVVADMSEKEYFPGMSEKEQEAYRKRILRHELIHAFLNESGLSCDASIPNCSWAKYEEMVDWIAIQLPKILNACRELGCI